MRRAALYPPKEANPGLTRGPEEGAPQGRAGGGGPQEEAQGQVSAWVGLGAGQDPSYIDREEKALAELLDREGV